MLSVEEYSCKNILHKEGIYKFKQICLRIRVKENLTAPRYPEFMKNGDSNK